LSKVKSSLKTMHFPCPSKLYYYLTRCP